MSVSIDTVTDFAKLAGVGLVSGLFASWLAIRDHRYRQWWELRVAAYRSVIEALSDLVDYYQSHVNIWMNQSNPSDDFRKQLEANRTNALRTVRRAADSGAFLFSGTATSALNDFFESRKQFDSDDPTDSIEKGLQTARNSLAAIVACSKKDLSLKRFAWW
jgi:hypothetical protein